MSQAIDKGRGRRSYARVRGSQCGAATIMGLVLLLSPACQAKLPTAPSELTTGIVIYEHANFLGASAHVAEDISDLRDFKGPCVESNSSGGTYNTTNVWNDCISSVRVAPGWTATLYRDTGYRDDSITITEDVSNLQLANHDCPSRGLNDCVSSIRVRRQ